MTAYSPFNYTAGRTTINNGATELGGLNDVNLTTPADAEVLTYNSISGKWLNAPQAVGGATLSSLTDTNLTGLTDGDHLTYDGATATWKNTVEPPIPSSINDLTDVDTTGITDNQYLRYNAGTAKFIPDSLPAQTPVAMSDITDTNIVSPVQDQVLGYNATTSKWDNVALPTQQPVASINDIGDATITAPTDGQYLKYDNATSQWINDTLPAVANLANFSFINDVIQVGGVDALGLTSAGNLDIKGDITLEKAGITTFLIEQFQSTAQIRFNDAHFNSSFLVANNASQPIFRVRGDGTIECPQLLTNVQTSGITSGDIIKYDGSNWVNTKTINTLNYDPAQPFDLSPLPNIGTNEITFRGSITQKTPAGSYQFQVNNTGVMTLYNGVVYNGAGNMLTIQSNPQSGFDYRFNDADALSKFRVLDSGFNTLFGVNGDGSINGITLNKLDNVSVPAPTDGQYLKYDNATSQWVADTLPSGANLANFSFITDNLQVGGTNKLDFGSGNVKVVNAPDLQIGSGTKYGSSQITTVVNTGITVINDQATKHLELGVGGSNVSTFGTVNFKSVAGATNMTILDNGTITGLPLSKISDTNISAPINGQVLTYDAGSSVWSNQAIPVQTVASINDIGDVVLTAPALDNYLRYDGLNWVNTAFPAIPSLANFSFINDIIQIGGATKLDFTVNGVRLTGNAYEVGATKYAATQVNTTTNTGLTFINEQATKHLEVGVGGSNVSTFGTLSIKNVAGVDNTVFNDDGSITGLPVSKLSDMTISAPALNEVLTYNGSQWINQAIPAQGLNDITDVNITALSDQQQLKYDSATSKWINFTPSGGGATGDYVFSGADITLTGQATPVLSSAQYQSNVNRNELIATCNKFTIKTEAVPAGHIEMVESGSSYFIDMTNRGAPATSSTLAMRNYNPNAWCRMQVNPTGGGGISLEGSQFIVQNNGLRYSVSPTNLHVWNSTINTAEEAYRWQVNGSGITALQIFGNGKIKLPQLTASSDVQTDGSSFLTTVSDERLKRDIVIVPPTEYGLAQIEQINPIRYNFITDPVGKPPTVGFSAQNILASGIVEGAPLNDDGFYGINSRAIMAAMLNAIKELSARVAVLETPGGGQGGRP